MALRRVGRGRNVTAVAPWAARQPSSRRLVPSRLFVLRARILCGFFMRIWVKSISSPPAAPAAVAAFDPGGCPVPMFATILTIVTSRHRAWAFGLLWLLMLTIANVQTGGAYRPTGF